MFLSQSRACGALFEPLEARLLLASDPVVSLGTVTSSTVSLNWSAIPGASAIRVYIAPEPSTTQGHPLPFSRLVRTLSGSSTTCRVDGLAPAVDVFLRLEADVPGETVATNIHARTVGGPDVALDTPIREVHSFGPNILQIVTSDTQTNPQLAGNNGVAWQEGAWRITRRDGTPVRVMQVYRHSLPMAAPSYTVGPNGQNSNDIITVDHRLYLLLDEDLGSEDLFTVTGPMNTSFVLPYSDEYMETPIIQLNQVGYSPRATERWAYVSGWMGDGGSLSLSNLPATVQVLSESSDPMARRPVVLSNLPLTVRSIYDSDTGGEVRQVDLSIVPAAEGVRYRIRVPGVGVSWVTAVSEEALFKAYYITSRGLYHNRWGGNLDAAHTDWVRAPDHTTVYTNELVYTGDTYFTGNEPKTGARTMIGGYHDAGDYDQYPVHTTITQDLLRAYELNPALFSDNQLTINESGNGIPDQLDQALWGIQGWICLQEADGGVRAGVQTFRHPGVQYADDDPDPYWTFARDADTTARAAGLFAQGARLVGPFDAARATDLRARAINAYNYARTHGAASRFLLSTTGELWKLTGDVSYKTAFEGYFDAGAWNNYDRMQDARDALPDFVAAYVSTPGARADIVATVINSLNADAADTRLDIDGDHAHRNPRPAGMNMGWGQGTSMGRWMDPTMVRIQFGNLSPQLRQQYYNELSLSADYILGANPFGYVWITELGSRHPDEALYCDSLAFKKDGFGQIPGVAVYGPIGGYGGYWTHSARSAFYPALINNITTSGSFGPEWPAGYQYGDARLLVESTEFTTHQVQAPTIELFATLIRAGMLPPPSWLPGGANSKNPLPGGMTPGNDAPTVDAGPNQGVSLATGALLNGMVTDDLFTPGFTTVWARVSGPGAVTFANVSQASTSASFSAPGRYILRLTANDGSLSGSDDVIIDVSYPEEFRADDNTIALYDFNGNYADSAWAGSRWNGSTLDLTRRGNASLSSSVGWMTGPAGQSLRVQAVGDGVDVKIPDKLLQPGGSTRALSIEARFYVTDYKAYAVGNVNLFALAQDWDTQVIVYQDMWAQVPSVIGNAGATVVNGSAWNAAVARNAWHLLKINFSTDAQITAYIDGVLVGSAVAAMNNGRTNDWTLAMGNFDGYIDDVRISNAVRLPNQLPVASAGADQSSLKATPTVLDGSVWDDGPVTTTWSRVSGPGTVSFADSSLLDTTATFSAGGQYVLRLTANDGMQSVFDEMTVTIVNARPIVDAGTDQELTGLTATLAGVVSDDGIPTSSPTSTWTKVSGPGSVTFGNATLPSTTATFSKTGRYVLRLTVADGSLAGYDEVTITARPANAYQYVNDANTTALYHFNGDLIDSSGHGYNLTAYGNATLTSENLDWMTVPAGQVLRLSDTGDRVSVTIPDSAVMPNSASTFTLEARLFVNAYKGYSLGNYHLISLNQDWDSNFALYQDMWTTAARIDSSNNTVVSAATFDAAAAEGAWHSLKITMAAGGLVSAYVDGSLLGSRTIAPNYGRAGGWLLTLGNFDGYLDEVRISNTVRAPDVTAPTVASVTINDGAAQRSMVNSLTVVFSEPVAVSAAPNVMTVLRTNGSLVPNTDVLATNPSGDMRTWQLTFSGSGAVGGSLADGMYNLFISAAGVTDLSGNALGANYTQRFHRLFGDSDGDRDVDNADLRRFRLAMNKLPVEAMFDYNGDYTVDRTDYLQFKLRLTRLVSR